jgi:hypothetical protein
LADSFQYYFETDSNQLQNGGNKPKRYDLFDEAYLSSVMYLSDDYMAAVKEEEDYLKSFKGSEKFEFPFKDYNYYFGHKLPYIIGCVLF